MTDKKRRGRPRSDAARARILAAARDLLNEGGIPAVTMEAVAARAGVGKPTIYRSWPNAHAVAMTALMEAQQPAASPDDGQGTAIDDLRRHLRSVVAAFATRAGRNAAALIAAADSDTEIAKAFRHNVILKGRMEGRQIILRAVKEGSISPAIDIEAALDLVYAPVFFRLLLGHGPLDEAFADSIIDHVLDGLRRRQMPGAK
jgi:AcrR family transcriptional regulator